MLKIAKRVYVAALLLIFSLAWMPLEAFAQLCVPGLTCPPPDTTPPAVRITSPASGATVSGTITVTADASDNVGVAGVQFKYNGIDLGPEDTSAPYTATANTKNVPDGTYVLTAVARDAAGNRATSNPVTVRVANSAPPPPPPPQARGRYEETDASVAFSAGWQSDSNWPWSGGSMAFSRVPGARATFTFTGTSVTWLGYRSTYGGIARVFVDGVYVTDVDLFDRASNELRTPAFTMSGLTNSSHTFTVEVTGLKNNDAVDTLVVVDAFDVPGLPVSRLQETDPAMTYTGAWLGSDSSKSWSGDHAAIASTPGAQAALSFNGTSISWIGYRGPDSGIARVYIDGGLAGQVDTYSPTQRVVDEIFTATGLADSSHTLTIEVTGLKNDASTGTRIVVDAFDVTTLGTRFDNTDSSVAYTGYWIHTNRNEAWDYGTVANSNTSTPGSQATFTFTGTSVSWIGRRGPGDAIARVYLDGVFVTDVDNYAPTIGLQDTVFTATGLAYGTHTLTIEVTGRKNPASPSAYPWVIVDAFDVRP